MYDNSAKVTKSIADAAMKVMMGESQQPEVLSEELKGDQHKIDKNKNKKIDAEDFKILRGEKKVEEQASKKKIDKFHTNLDKLVHKSFGHSSDEMKKEEVEQIDELSKKTLGSYAKRAAYDTVTKAIDYGSNMDQSGSQHKELSKINKRERGVQKAIDRLTKEEVELTESHFKVGDKVKCKTSGMKGEVVKLDKEHGDDDEKYYTVKREDGKEMKMAPEDMTKLNEEAEQLDELSKDTLKSYADKSFDSYAKHVGKSRDAEDKSQLSHFLGKHKKGQKLASKSLQHRDKADKRWAGYEKASDRLSKEEVEIEEGTKVQVAPGRTRNIGTHGRAQGSAFGGTDWDKEESEKEDKPKTRRKYGARQNYTRSTRVNESFTDMLEMYNEGGVKALLQNLRNTEIEIEEEATNDEFKAELDKAQAKSEGREKANVAQALVTASKRFDEEVELEEGIKNVYHKIMAKRSQNKADHAFDMGDEKEFAKNVDKAEYHRVKAGGKPTKINTDPNKKSLTYREEVEQIDELSKDTLDSYTKKAKADKKHAQSQWYLGDRDDEDYQQKLDKIYAKRSAGLNRVKSRMKKEETELEERELSSSEKETKEKYVKGMKKGLQGFKQRYGDRAKEVMYATATKMAKKED